MGSAQSNSVIDPRAEQKLFMTGDASVGSLFGFHFVTVKQGQQGVLLRDGAYEQTLQPGIHRWFRPFTRYSLSFVDVTTINLPAPVVGQIPGPLDAQGRETPPCRVQMPLTLVLQVQNIEKFLMVKRPVSLLLDITTDRFITLAKQVRWDMHQVWSLQLKASLFRWLAMDAADKTGIRVEDVLLTGEIDGTSEQDKRRLKEYQMETATQLSTVTTDSRNRQAIARAQTAAEEARILGIPPQVLGIMREPEGARIIEAETRLRELQIATSPGTPPSFLPPSGSTYPPGGSAMPNIPQIASGNFTGPVPPGATGPYSNNAPNPNGFTPPFPGSVPRPPIGEYPSASTPPSAPMGGQYMPTPNSSTSAFIPTTPLEARMADERRRFNMAEVHYHEGPATVKSITGVQEQGYQVTVITMQEPRIVAQFQLSSSYPHLAPVVRVQWPKALQYVEYSHPMLLQWNAQQTLESIWQAIVAEASSHNT